MRADVHSSSLLVLRSRPSAGFPNSMLHTFCRMNCTPRPVSKWSLLWIPLATHLQHVDEPRLPLAGLVAEGAQLRSSHAYPLPRNLQSAPRALVTAFRDNHSPDSTHLCSRSPIFCTRSCEY